MKERSTNQKSKDKIVLTGEQAFNFGVSNALYQKSKASDNFNKLTFCDYFEDGFIVAKDEKGFAVVLREEKEYILYTDKF